jgi:hypothetical protein
MKRFLLLYSGPPTPPDAQHQGWPEWFTGLGDALVDVGSPLANGFALRADGSESGDASRFNGFSVIEAESRREAVELLRTHPLLALGADYAIEVFELGRGS